MGKKVWLSMQPRHFGSDKIVRPYVRPPLDVRWGEILHFKHPVQQCCRTAMLQNKLHVYVARFFVPLDAHQQH